MRFPQGPLAACSPKLLSRTALSCSRQNTPRQSIGIEHDRSPCQGSSPKAPSRRRHSWHRSVPHEKLNIGTTLTATNSTAPQACGIPAAAGAACKPSPGTYDTYIKRSTPRNGSGTSIRLAKYRTCCAQAARPFWLWWHGSRGCHAIDRAAVFFAAPGTCRHWRRRLKSRVLNRVGA